MRVDRFYRALHSGQIHRAVIALRDGLRLNRAKHGRAAAFQTLLDHGKWLILEMNGQVYPDKPPLYFLFLRGLYELVRTDGPMLYFAAAAVSGLLYLWSSLALGRLAIRVDRRTNLAAGISPVPLSHGEVIEAGQAAGPRISALLAKIVERI